MIFSSTTGFRGPLGDALRPGSWSVGTGGVEAETLIGGTAGSRLCLLHFRGCCLFKKTETTAKGVTGNSQTVMMNG